MSMGTIEDADVILMIDGEGRMDYVGRKSS